MLEWLRRRGQRPKPLAELAPEELDALLAEHPALEQLLRHTFSIMQFAPPRAGEVALARVGAIVDEVLRRRLPPHEEHAYVMRELEAVRRLLADPDAVGRGT